MNPKMHFATHAPPVAFRAHAESKSKIDCWIDCDNSTVPLLSIDLRVTFLTPVVLRGAIYCTSVAVRTLRDARSQRPTNPMPASSARIPAAQGYPEKQFRKTSLR
jgi:hypothetical protein